MGCVVSVRCGMDGNRTTRTARLHRTSNNLEDQGLPRFAMGRWGLVFLLCAVPFSHCHVVLMVGAADAAAFEGVGGRDLPRQAQSKQVSAPLAASVSLRSMARPHEKELCATTPNQDGGFKTAISASTTCSPHRRRLLQLHA